MVFNLALRLECGRNKLLPRHTKNIAFMIGGNETNPNTWVWQVAIYVKKDNIAKEYSCGGTLITPDRVLTAAHCVFNSHKINVKIIVGDHIR